MKPKLKNISILIILLISYLIILLKSPPTLTIAYESNNCNPKYIEIPPRTISILQLYRDAMYAWEKLQTRRDIYGSNQTALYYYTEANTNSNISRTASVELLPTFYSLFKLTNNEAYLDYAWEMFQDIIDKQLGQIVRGRKAGEVLFGYDWLNDQILNSSVCPIVLFIPIAQEDPRYLPYFERLISGNHELFWSPRNLIYDKVRYDGLVTSRNHHLTWTSTLGAHGLSGVHRQISQLFWMYHLTANLTYKQWADETIEATWSYRSRNTNLLPRSVDAGTGIILDNTITHYDMAGWLNVLELAYLLNGQNKSAGTDLNTYYDLIFQTAKAISSYMWNVTEKRWVYKCQYTTKTQYPIAEMNAIYVDYMMIRAYEITGEEEFLEKAIQDFNSEFMGSDMIYPNGTLMQRSLIVHSPATFSTQSQFQGSSNLMVGRTAYLIFLYTQNEEYLRKSYIHYQQLMGKHRNEKGYICKLDTNTMEPYGYYNNHYTLIYEGAPYKCILDLPSAFIPSGNVTIDWGYGLSTSMPNDYGVPGVFTGVTIDLHQKSVRLNRVTSKGDGRIFINFGRGYQITSVKIDNHPYLKFNESNLYCEAGTHTYYLVFEQSTNNDADKDGLPDSVESKIFNTSIFKSDTDNDSLEDWEETLIYLTDALDPDSDDDGLLDGEELKIYSSNPLDSDSDDDGILDGDDTFNTDPLRVDTDGDGLFDFIEVRYNTNPSLFDTDFDLLSDYREIKVYHTDPLNNDTDNDGVLDGVEIETLETNPLNNDTDSDCIPDGWEWMHFLNPKDASDAEEDPDRDELNNLGEFQNATNPHEFDTDKDHLGDGIEIKVYHTDPLSPDSDNDGLTDYIEIMKYGTNPQNKDTDYDGLLDNEDPIPTFNIGFMITCVILITLFISSFAFLIRQKRYKNYR